MEDKITKQRVEATNHVSKKNDEPSLTPGSRLKMTIDSPPSRKKILLQPEQMAKLNKWGKLMLQENKDIHNFF